MATLKPKFKQSFTTSYVQDFLSISESMKLVGDTFKSYGSDREAMERATKATEDMLKYEVTQSKQANEEAVEAFLEYLNGVLDKEGAQAKITEQGHLVINGERVQVLGEANEEEPLEDFIKEEDEFLEEDVWRVSYMMMVNNVGKFLN